MIIINKGDIRLKYIQSSKNPQIKQWKKLLTKKERDQTGLFLVEGFHLVEEALKANDIIELILDENTDLPSAWNYGDISVTTVPSDIIKYLSDTETPQGIIAVCEQKREKIKIEKGKNYLLLDAIQDPGNLGTIIRTADAAGVEGVILGNGTVDFYNPKVVRSAQGSHFHLVVEKGDLLEWISEFSKNEISIYGTSLENGRDFTTVTPSANGYALVVGNEGNGVNKELLARATENLYIPIYGKSESLNVAVATGILLYFLRK